MSSKRRIAVVVIAVTIAAAALGWWWYRRTRPPVGFLVGLYPLDASRAVVLLRVNSEDDSPSRAWIAVVDRESGVKWRHELDGIPRHGPYDEMSVSDSVVTVGVTGEEWRTVAVAGYEIEDGAKLWQFDFPGKESEFAAFNTLGNAELVVAYTREDASYWLTAINRANGEVRWRRPADLWMTGYLVAGHLVRPDLFSTRFVSLASGEVVVTQDNRGPGCELGSEYYGLVSDGETYQLVAASVEHPDKQRVVTSTFALPVRDDLPGFFSVVACGLYDGALVFAIERRRADTRESLELVAVDPGTGEVRWSLDLGAVHLSSSLPQFQVNWMYRHSSPLQGTLTRFVPVALAQYGGEPRVAILDLREHRVHRLGAANHDLIYFAFMRVGSRYYFAGTHLSVGLVVAVVDGETGELTAAIQAGTFQELFPHHIADGVVWLYTRDWKSLEDAPWAALDAVTLAPIRNQGVPIEDGRGVISELWKLEAK